MKHASIFSVTDIVDFTECIKNSVGRHKKLYVVNLPPFAQFLFEAARATLNEKFKKRIVIAKDMEELKNYIDSSLLPSEFGGKYTEKEHQDLFNDYFKAVKPKLEEIKARVVDWTKVPDFKSTVENIGSFRKLEID